jgi:hypothetical protein
MQKVQPKSLISHNNDINDNDDLLYNNIQCNNKRSLFLEPNDTQIHIAWLKCGVTECYNTWHEWTPALFEQLCIKANLLSRI